MGQELRLTSTSSRPFKALSEPVGANEIYLIVVVPSRDGLELLLILREHHATNGIEPSVAFRTLIQESTTWHESLKTENPQKVHRPTQLRRSGVRPRGKLPRPSGVSFPPHPRLLAFCVLHDIPPLLAVSSAVLNVSEEFIPRWT